MQAARHDDGLRVLREREFPRLDHTAVWPVSGDGPINALCVHGSVNVSALLLHDGGNRASSLVDALQRLAAARLAVLGPVDVSALEEEHRAKGGFQRGQLLDSTPGLRHQTDPA